MGLNRYLQLNLEHGNLFALAAELGSDVSFFLNGPLALCMGKGEKIRELDENFNFLVLLVLPGISVSTRRVYGNYKHNQALYERLSAQLNFYVEQKKIDLIVKMCTNMLQESCFELEKSLAELRETVESLDIGPCCLSGSGSAMFCFIASGDEQEAVCAKRRIEHTSAGAVIHV